MTILSVVINEGNLSARPASGINGRLFFATDVGKIYRDVVSGWDDVTPAGAFKVNPVTLPAANGGSSYALPVTPSSPAASLYFVRGQKWKYGIQYSISGSTLTIIDTARAPQTGDIHELYAS